MKKKTIIGIVGEQAGGKGAAADIIIKKYGGTRLTVSNVLKRTLDNLHIPASRENFTKLSGGLRQAFGETIFMEAMLKDVEEVDNELVIVDGIRMLTDPPVFKREYGANFHLLYVTADTKIRHKRSMHRGEKAGESDTTLAQFKINEEKDTEKSIPDVGAKADYKITNNGNYEELEKQVISFMNKI